MAQSRCVYCGSANFGSGCRYSPKGIHFHPDDAKHCSFCGSANYGKGCRYAPDSIHVHGIEYNGVMKESVSGLAFNSIILSLLNKPIEEYKAYQLGLIDLKGNIIKKPITLQEQVSLSHDIRTILSLKKMLGEQLQTLNGKVQLESAIASLRVDENKRAYYQEQLDGIFNDLSVVVEQSLEDGVPLGSLLGFLNS